MTPLAPASTAKILVAEDSPTQAQRLRMMLQGHGYEVQVATNGRAALEAARASPPSLVISDVNMPEMNGYELTRAIKAEPGISETPVILVTTMSDPQEVIRGLECGADSFILKPYNDDFLVGRIQYVLINRQYRHLKGAGMGVEIHFNGQRHYITADRMQILDLLLSTYEAAIQRNKELTQSKEALERMAAEVVASNRFLDSVIENVPIAIFMKDATDLRHVRVNRDAEKLTGYLRTEMLDKDDFALFPAEYASQSTSHDRSVLADGEVSEIPALQLPIPGRGTRTLHVKKVPIIDQYGRTTHLLGIAEDVTERTRMEQDIRRLNAELEQRASRLEASNKGLEGFAAAASHDLRSPLSIIGSYAGFLGKHYGHLLDARGLGYLEAITRNIRHTATLIDDLLAFSRSTSKTVTKELVAMQELVAQVVNDQVGARPEGSTAPQVRIGSLPDSHADPVLLRQVWTNLVSNALKYSSKNAAPVVEISGRAEPGGHVYSVRDNGVGFDMDEAGKLFEAFQRLHAASEFEGTGMGLVIVQQIVLRHGGRIWADSKPGEGATFCFTLPWTPESTQAFP